MKDSIYLFRQISTRVQTKILEIGQAQLKLSPAQADPWAEVEVVKMLGGIFSISDNILENGEILTEVDPEDFAPFNCYYDITI